MAEFKGHGRDRIDILGPYGAETYNAFIGIDVEGDGKEVGVNVSFETAREIAQKILDLTAPKGGDVRGRE
jgi:hypothetical protein